MPSMPSRHHTFIPLRHYACSAPPDLHAFTSTRLQRASSAPYLHACTPTVTSVAPEPNFSMSPRLHAFIVPPIGLGLNFGHLMRYSCRARLFYNFLAINNLFSRRGPLKLSRARTIETSFPLIPTHVYVLDVNLPLHCRAPELYASTPTSLPRGSRAPQLDTSTSTRLRLRGSRQSRTPWLHRSMAPYRHTYNAPPRAPYLYTSTSLRLQRASSAPYLHVSMSTRLQLTSSAPYLRVTTLGSRLQTSRVPQLHDSTYARLQRGSRVPELHTYMPPYLHAYNAPPELQDSASASEQSISRATWIPIAVSPRLNRTGTAPYLYASTSLHPQRL